MVESNRVELSACISTTQTGTAAFVGLCSDGRTYWIKAENNPQGVRSLVPERIVTNIGLAIGAPVRPIALVAVPDGLDFQFSPGLRLKPGVAHGSLDLGKVRVLDDWTEVASRDDNRRRIASLAALWDLCLGNDEQWLSELDNDAALWSFDHGFWLAGEADWSADSMRRVADRPWQLGNVEEASASALNAAAAAVEALTQTQLETIAHDVPSSWGTSREELSDVAAILFLRRAVVAERLRSAAAESVWE